MILSSCKKKIFFSIFIFNQDAEFLKGADLGEISSRDFYSLKNVGSFLCKRFPCTKDCET